MAALTAEVTPVTSCQLLSVHRLQTLLDSLKPAALGDYRQDTSVVLKREASLTHVSVPVFVCHGR